VRNRGYTKHAILALVLVALTLTISTCGHSSAVHPSQFASTPQPSEISLDAALAELDALPIPGRRKARSLSAAQDALAKQLREKSMDKVVSTPPTGDVKQRK